MNWTSNAGSTAQFSPALVRWEFVHVHVSRTVVPKYFASVQFKPQHNNPAIEREILIQLHHFVVSGVI